MCREAIPWNRRTDGAVAMAIAHLNQCHARVCMFSPFPPGSQIVFYQDVDAETQFFDQPGTYELRAPAFFLNQVQGARGRACLNTCC